MVNHNLLCRSSHRWNDALLVEQKLWLQLITTVIVNLFTSLPYFILFSLRKKRAAKQNADTASGNACGTPACRIQTGKDDRSEVILAQTNGSQENGNISGGKEDYVTDGEKKKKKSSQPKDIRRTDLKRYYSIGEFNARHETYLFHYIYSLPLPQAHGEFHHKNNNK